MVSVFPRSAAFLDFLANWFDRIVALTAVCMSLFDCVRSLAAPYWMTFLCFDYVCPPRGVSAGKHAVWLLCGPRWT